MSRSTFSICSRMLTLAVAATLCSTTASADPDSRRERTQERADLAEAKAEVRDDQVDLQSLNDIVEDWHRARANRNRAAERRADERIERWYQRELTEAKTEVREAQQEVKVSANEVRSEQGDAKRAQRRGKHKAAKHQRAELQDDKRDLRDDKQDLVEQQRDLGQLQRIARDLERMQPKFRSNRATPAHYAKKSALLRELQALARDEVRDSKNEVREDKIELREDRK